MEQSNISDEVQSLASILFEVADEAIDLNNDESMQKVLRPLISFLQNISNRRGVPFYDQIKRISSHQSPNESSRLQRGPADKHDEHTSRNTRDSDGASASERTRPDEDGEASQDQRCLTTRETSSLTEVPSSKDAVDKTKKKHKKKKPEKPEEFEVNPEYLKSLVEWIDSPESFFNQNIEVTIGHRIGRFLIDIERSIDLNSIKWRYIVRQIYLSRESWKRYETKAFNLLLVGDTKTVGKSTIRFWIKEGEFYEFLCTKFGIGCLFCDVAKTAEARIMPLPTEDKPSNPKLDEHIATLRDRNIEAVSEQYKLVATKIATYMRDKQIMAGLLKPSKRVADELSDTPGTPLKKVCQRTSPDQPSRLIIQDSAGSSHLRQSAHSTTRCDPTCGTGKESAGTGTEMVADDNRSGDGIGGPEPPNAALGLRNDQLSIPSPQSTSHNLLQKFPENNAMLSSPKTTAATMSTTSTPLPASNTDAETQLGREDTLSDRLQTESQKTEAVSGTLSPGWNSLVADGSPPNDHTASSHSNNGIPQGQPSIILSPSHTDISSVSAPMPDKFNSMPSQQQSSHEQQQNNQLHGDYLQTSQQSTMIGRMGMGESVASLSTPVPEPRYFESSRNISEKSAGQESAPIVAQGEEEQQPGSPHNELQNQDRDIEAGAELDGNPDTCPQADTIRTHNLLNESQDSRSPTYSCQSRYCSGPATNDDTIVDAGQPLRQSPAERATDSIISSYGFGCTSANFSAYLPDEQAAIRDSQWHTIAEDPSFPRSPILPNSLHDQTKRFQSQQRADLSSSELTATSWSTTGLPSPSRVEPGQEGASLDIRDAYDQQPGSTPNTRFSPISLTSSQVRPLSGQPASGPRVDISNLHSHGAVTASALTSRETPFSAPGQTTSTMQSASIDSTNIDSFGSSEHIPQSEESRLSEVFRSNCDHTLAPTGDSTFDAQAMDYPGETSPKVFSIFDELLLDSSWEFWYY